MHIFDPLNRDIPIAENQAIKQKELKQVIE